MREGEPCNPPDRQAQPGPSGPREWGLGVGLAIVLGYFCVHAIAAVAAAQLVPDASSTLWASLAGNVAVVLLLVLFAGRHARGGSSRSVLGLVSPDRFPVARVLGVLGAGFVAYVTVSVAMGQLWQFMEPDQPDFPRQFVVTLVTSLESPLLLAVAVLLAVFLAPLAEELVFRRALYLPLRRTAGVLAAALLVSLTFGFAHAYLWGLPQLTVLSVVFVALYECTGSLWASVLAHAAYNALMLALVFHLDGAL